MPVDPVMSAPGPDGAAGPRSADRPAGAEAQSSGRASARGGAGAVLTRSREELARALERAPAPRAVVMTMGALHEGHFDLVREAARRVGEAGTVVVTIFVNPLQFAAGEDLESYPRDLEGDLEGLERALSGPQGRLGVGRLVVFAPTPEVIYPDGPPRVRIDPGPMSTVLEGRTRPTHFAGVCQVVLALLHLTSPRWALFGRKDAQQLAIVTAMVEDLAVPVEIVPVDIRREPDGLAMSSRNAYLTADQRGQALALSAALEAGRRAAAGGAGPAAVRTAAEAVLARAPGVATDYVALVDPATFTDLTGQGPGLPPSSGIGGEQPGGPGRAERGRPGYAGPGRALLAVAARVGSTRLIDNCLVDLPADRG
ncbi:pantoate--beta-alanine ligase [Actinomyces capricornis]|uniref:pantoate--beta-alanine ligase n=1 Tax=Actinomyces capricornis TaxID=2755559 RepID=UPI001CC771EF|nr:pantoate--beta-alanine ligase [Actinomyces capricornis]